MWKPQSQIIIARDRELKDKRFYVRRIWLPARHEAQFFRSRAWLDALTLLYDVSEYIYDAEGALFPVPEVDEVFRDHDMRWMRLFLEADASGAAPKRYSHKLDRLRLIELYCRVRQMMDNAPQC